MPTYRLLAMDIDGTLVGPDLVVSDRVRETIAAVTARGCRPVLATGRMYQAAHPFALQLGLPMPIIAYHGGLVRLPGEVEELYHLKLSADVALEVLDRLDGANFQVNVFRDDIMYVRGEGTAPNPYLAFSDVVPRLCKDWRSVLAGDGPTKIVATGTRELVDRWTGLLQAEFAGELGFPRGQATFLELVHPHASKGRALAALAARMGIAREEIVAIGDAPNDIDMLELAGLGIAMGNAHTAVQAAADRVTSPWFEDGLANAIQELMSNGDI